VYELPYKRTAQQHSALRAVAGDWVLSTNWAFGSGTRYNALIGSDANLDGNSNDRPYNGDYILGRNTFRGASSAVVDVRLAKRIPFGERVSGQIQIESFNIQNRVNLNSPNTTWGNQLKPAATFGQFNAAGDPRQMQIGFRLQF